MNESDIESCRKDVYESFLAADVPLINAHIANIEPGAEEATAIAKIGVGLIKRIRGHSKYNKGLDAFMAEYGLNTQEGIRLMTLAEALIRIPDEETKESLIKSKLTGADWADHLGKSLSLFVNSSTRALLFTSSVLDFEDKIPFLSEIIKKLGEPAIRVAVEIAMGMFSQHFVMAEKLSEVSGVLTKEKNKYRYSFDMLGEAAFTKSDAQRYFNAYKDAIVFAGEYENAAVSIKLSALHPRYDIFQKQRVISELLPRLIELFVLAKESNVQITIDAEEAERLELCMELIEGVLKDGSTLGWHKMGLAVQAYTKRGLETLKYLEALARQYDERIFVRLVKGAYWDTEVKMAQIQGLVDYPVFTSKVDSDIAYLGCAKYLIDEQQHLYPQFATHNVQTVATLLHWTRGKDISFEFQRLHGMGDLLYDSVIKDYPDTQCCIYAPVGRQKELLPYLIRRLLENSANSSFVNQLAGSASAEELAVHPVQTKEMEENSGKEKIVKPSELYMPERQNSVGFNLRFISEQHGFMPRLKKYTEKTWTALPSLLTSKELEPDKNPRRKIYSPANTSLLVGELTEASEGQAIASVEAASQAFNQWKSTNAEERKEIFRKFSDLLESHTPELVVLMARETGKIIADCLSEIREAVDFSRYYASQIDLVSGTQQMPGPSGELNEFRYTPRGVFLCISPWNFPVAIYCGQIIAALVTGNTVIAKPAEESSLTAYRVWQLFIEAGVPEDALQFVPGAGETIGDALSRHKAIAGVVFTGSVATGHIINRNLAQKQGPIVPFIAETGGQNVMFADSSALPEQVVADVIMSAFNSAGQRCSALRVLYVQDSCAEAIIELLKGAAAELKLGDPLDLSTDLGPLISDQARDSLMQHITQLDKVDARLIYKGSNDLETFGGDAEDKGYFLAPHIYEISSISSLTEEHFGPILHIIRYKPKELPEIFSEINHLGYGLTLGVHSRNEKMVEYVSNNVHAGNIYVNRNMIGAVVESQPFGGMGLSGTGPKAGGPNYLKRFMHEVSVSTNTAAVGGAVDLINQ